MLVLVLVLRQQEVEKWTCTGSGEVEADDKYLVRLLYLAPN